MGSSSAFAAFDTVCHDARSSLVLDTVGDLATAANDTATTRFAYDDHRVTRAETLIGSSVFDIAWTRDACGLVTNLDYGTGFSVSRTYDRAGRLVRVGDSLGHAWSFTYNITNRPVRETFAYDRTGALTNATRRLPSGESASFFAATYDAQGRLASLGGGADAPPVAFAYDALGNRVRTGDRLLVPDHDDPLKRPLLECASDGSILRQYLWGPTGLLGFIDASGTLTVAYADEQGSVIALTTPEGAILFRATYGPHGEDWGMSGSNPTPFAWLGGLGVMRFAPSLVTDDSALYTPHSALYLTRHRLYSPVLQRFLSADPLGMEGGLNLYAYANGDPLAYVDPLGLCATSAISSMLDYLGESVNQVLLGNYTEDVTFLGTAGEVAAGVFGVDLPMDVRDIFHDLTHWENSWGHVGKTGLDVVGVLPLVGVLKYGDEVGVVLKKGFRTSGVTDTASKTMIGARGTQITSKTTWKSIGGRIDVENPAPGKRPGQIHFQDASGSKYLYDPVSKLFLGAPKSVNERLDDPLFRQGVDKGLKYLGEL